MRRRAHRGWATVVTGYVVLALVGAQPAWAGGAPLGHPFRPDSLLGQWAVAFQKVLMERKTGVDVYVESSTWGSSRQLFEMVQYGKLDVAIVSLSAIPVPEVQVLSLPALVTDRAMAAEIRRSSDFRERMERRLMEPPLGRRDAHLVPLGVVWRFARIVSVGSPVVDPAQLKGMRIGAWKDEPFLVQSGAQPVHVDGPDIGGFLRKGAIQAVVAYPESWLRLGREEITGYATGVRDGGLLTDVYVMLAGERFRSTYRQQWDAVVAAGRQAAEHFEELDRSYERDAETALAKYSLRMQVLSPEQLADWRRHAERVAWRSTGTHDSSLLDLLIRLTRRVAR